MKTLIISLLVLFAINISNGLLVLPYNNVPATIAAGDKIGIPISNDKFIISNCAALGNTYLYTENNEVTDYSPVAYFRDSTTLELYIPDVGSNTAKKYFIVVELPLAEAIIKTEKFTVIPGSNINLPKTDGCGKTVRFSNKEAVGSTISGKINPNDNNGNNLNANNNNGNTNLNNNANNNGNEANNINGNVANNNGNNDNNNGKISNNKSNILTAESTSDTTAEEEGGSNNAVIIALSGTSVVALVVISGLVLMRGKSYMKKSDEDISYSSLNYVSPKPYDPVGGLYDNLTNSNNDYERDYQLRCLQNDNQSQVSYPISLSDGSCVNMDKNSDVFEANEDIPVPNLPRNLPMELPPKDLPPMNLPNNNQEDLPITKHVVEEIVINPEKVLSETINSNAVSAFVTTASVALAINECGDLTIDNSNIIVEKQDTTTEKSNTTSGTCTSCSTSSCSSCNNCSCSCNGSGTCSCTCNESSRYTTTTTDESSLKLLSLDLNNSKPFTSFNFANNSNMGDTTRGYSVFVDNDSKKDSVALSTYTETNYDDSRRMTNYTETNYYDSRRMTDYTETTGYDDSRRDTQYTDYTTDSRRDTQYTDYTVDSRRDTQYTDYTVDSRRDTQYTDYTVDSRRDTQYTDYTVDSRRDTQYTDYTVDSRRDTQYTDYTTEDSRRDTQYTDYTVDSRRDTQYTDYTTEDSRRDTQYTDYTEGTSYTTDRDSRRYTDYTEGSSYTNRDSRYTDYTEGSSYSSCSCSGSECECGRRNTQYSEYTSEYTSYTTDSRRQTYTTDFTSTQYSESRDVSESEPSRILPLSTLEPFGGIVNTSSFIDVLQSKQPALRESVYSLLPTGPITTKPPKLDIEFVAQNDLETDKPGELIIKKRDVVRIVENLDGGYYMATNGTTGASGKIPAYKILSIL